MKITRKEKAIELLKELDIYKPYIEGFSNENKVCFFEEFGGFWVEQEPEIYEKMKEIENTYNCLVYAITHEFTDFGELYDFLILPEDSEDWDSVVRQASPHSAHAYAYVWNKTADWCSEFGTIVIEKFAGRIKRTV